MRHRVVMPKLLIAVASVTAVGAAWVAGAKPMPQPLQPDVVPGEFLVQTAPRADVRALANSLGSTVSKKLPHSPNVYLMKSRPGVSSLAAMSVAQQRAGVAAVSPNFIYRKFAVPRVTANDQFSLRQWPLSLINAQEAWGITVGQRALEGPKEVTVAVIDDGVSFTHPDFQGIVLPGGYDFGDDDSDPSHDASDPTAGHGTAVTGCIAPLTNNREGISGVAWEGVSILPVKIFDGAGATTSDKMISAIDFAVASDVDVINMSLGRSAFFGPTAVERDAVKRAVDAGVVVVAASGNSRDPSDGFSWGVGYPAAYPEVIAVGSVGPEGTQSVYSDYGPDLDVSAPGGNDDGPDRVPALPSDPSRLYFSTSWDWISGDGYAGTQGTSFASPTVAGAAAVLLAEDVVPQELTGRARVEFIRNILQSTARNPRGRFTNELGYGVIDLAAALKASTVWIDLGGPSRDEVTPSLAEPLRARISLPFVPGQVQQGTVEYGDDFVVLREGVTMPSNQVDIDARSGEFQIQPDFDTRWNPGINRIDIQAKSLDGTRTRTLRGDAEGNIPARDFHFRVELRTERAGLKMFGMPYSLPVSGTDTYSFLLGGQRGRFARWLPAEDRYAVFDTVGSPQDPEADLVPPGADVARAPVGMGYWARFDANTPLQLFGVSETAASYRIPLQVGWNMISNPYPFAVPWPSVNVDTGSSLLTVQQAAQQNFILAQIYRFDGTRYQFSTPPFGDLLPWQGQWVRALKPCTLVVSRIRSTVSTASVARKPENKEGAAYGGWRLTATAVTNGAVNADVTIGKAANAADKFGSEDVQAPPPAPVGADIRVRNKDWGVRSGAYVQDLRRLRKSNETWDLEVAAFDPAQDVTVRFGQVPNGVRIMLLDVEKGQIRPLKSGMQVTVKPGRGVYKLQLKAEDK